MNLRPLMFGALAVLIACGTSNVANDADVTVSGVLRLPDGGPAAAVPVVLVEEPSGIDALFELTVTVTSIGMLCLTQQVSFCKGARRATTDEEGRYSFTMKGKDAKSILGNPAHFALSARLDSGPRIQTRFPIEQAEVKVPEARFWQPDGLRVQAGPQRVEYSWPPLAGAKHRLEVTEADELVWAQESAPNGSFDARAIADAQGEFRAIARVERDGFTTDHHSQPVAVSGQAGAPPSRGSGCTLAGVTPQPCGFTDGRYAGASLPQQVCPSASASASPGTCGSHTWITIDLGAARQVTTVFLHGLSTSKDFEVSVSADGAQWNRYARHKRAGYVALTGNSPVSARYVRVQSESLHALQEASVWG
ncbi:discoidin domain-containing protein [Allorhizocola rhizosphaerae]|uniref:discoidin domain-containing protein n=1 Tax=Allorhizocola rhizosphaerae TaxID=1872709 RepID=UPI0013C2E0AA|nr:discoidin domain-containing protein [Allorhizocola rhizosphaerae]